jgi:hypothetical protein
MGVEAVFYGYDEVWFETHYLQIVTITNEYLDREDDRIFDGTEYFLMLDRYINVTDIPFAIDQMQTSSGFSYC